MKPLSFMLLIGKFERLVVFLLIHTLVLEGYLSRSWVNSVILRRWKAESVTRKRAIHEATKLSSSSQEPVVYKIENTTSYGSIDFLATENHEIFLKSEGFSLRPNHTCIELEYDYLSTDSLNAIKAYPFVKIKKGRSYLIRWWQAAKKWGLLSEELLEVERRVRRNLNSLLEHDKITSSATSIVTSVNSFTTTNEKYEEEFLNTIVQELSEISKQHIARVIVIGDIHGCIEEFCEILRKVKYLPGDQVLLLGDLVAKGPYSSDTVRLAMDISALAVRGNHDQETLRQFTLLKNNETNKEASKHLKIAKHLSLDQIQWLANLPYYIRSKDLGVVFVHAGMEDGINLENQLPSVMLTIRSLVKGDSDSRRKPSSICYLAHPWAPSWKGPLKIYFGHDSARGFQRYETAIGIDTGCVYGGNLTAVLLPDEEVVQVPALKAYLAQQRKMKLTYKDLETS